MTDIKLGQRVFVGYGLYRVMARNGNGDLFLLPIHPSGERDKQRGEIQASIKEVSNAPQAKNRGCDEVVSNFIASFTAFVESEGASNE